MPAKDSYFATLLKEDDIAMAQSLSSIDRILFIFQFITMLLFIRNNLIVSDNDSIDMIWTIYIWF